MISHFVFMDSTTSSYSIFCSANQLLQLGYRLSSLLLFFLVFLEYTICRVSHCLVDSANIVVLPFCRIWSNRGKRLLKCTAIEYYDDRGTFSSTICLNLGAGVSVG